MSVTVTSEDDDDGDDDLKRYMAKFEICHATDVVFCFLIFAGRGCSLATYSCLVQLRILSLK